MNKQRTWWGQEFVSALEGFIDAGRLQRGKSYRTDNRVLKFDLQANQIDATIRGNVNPYYGVYEEPHYQVKLKFRTISASDWQTIITNLCANAGWLSKLMLNEIPDSIQQGFTPHSLLPASFNDIDASCSCPDHANPCKHIAGVYYRIAEQLDTNPMLLFQLRGLSPLALQKALAATELGQVFAEHLAVSKNVELETTEHRYPVFECDNASDPAKQTVNLAQFWQMKLATKSTDTQSTDSQSTMNAVEQSELSTMTSAALIKKQGDYPEFWSRNNSFIGAMEDIYEAVRKKNNKQLF
ncbi:SWIM zinc finger family protein [Algibacillus agarilyticus]|uniref:SWIM zinc finger family protein n=1 Tax=Algibacillus agarilyticus TaxID=2234133 RepID=UPI000DCFCC92|nr:SWIM zinc finger family protein [Algibacillus agarilyticus]